MAGVSELRDQHGGVWGAHPDYPVADWQMLVSNNDTRSGYWEWVAAELEFAENGSGRTP